MAALILGGSAERVTEWSRVTVARSGELLTEGWAALCINCAFRAGWRAIQHPFALAAQLFKFFRADDVLEDVETVFPIGVQDVLFELPVRIQSDRAAVADGVGTLSTRMDVFRHGMCVIFG